MTFSSFGLSKNLLLAIDEAGYSTPTPIQAKAIPAVMSGRDIMAVAQTGTGKTAGFTLPMLQRLSGRRELRANHIRALVMVPTRELAQQVGDSIKTYGKYLSLKSAVVYGGVAINPQMMKLRGGIDVLVATPGRLVDLYGQNAVKFSQTEILVLDEADRMLDMGFKEEIDQVLALLPKKRQNLLFSATFSAEIRRLTGRILKDPLKIEVNPQNSTAKSVRQWAYEVDKSKKTALLGHLIRKKGGAQILVFTRTKIGADRLVQKLGASGIAAAAIHGDKSQALRSRTLADFKSKRLQVLIATDIVARGIDINELPCVINFELPKVAEDYIHRIGRSGRAGLEGEAISLVSADEVKLLSAIETLIRKHLVREVEAGFIPLHSVPLTKLRDAPKKPKKPKKTKHGRGEEIPADKGKKLSVKETGKQGRPRENAEGRKRKRGSNEASVKGRRKSSSKRGERTGQGKK